MAHDLSAHTNIKKPRFLYRLGLSKRPFQMVCDYRGDGIGTKNKSLKFLDDPSFIQAWSDTAAIIEPIVGEKLPDIRWRAQIAVWAAKQGLAREGDFVECGVHSGILANVICRTLAWPQTGRKFWLFDTWSGIPTDAIPTDEKTVADSYNVAYHKQDIFTQMQQVFAPFPQCSLVRGFLPDTLHTVPLEKIAYLSIDLNNATYEKACIEVLWPKLTSGAIVLLDDYNFTKCRLQQDMWDAFAASQSLMIAPLPTGQGLLIKP